MERGFMVLKKAFWLVILFGLFQHGLRAEEVVTENLGEIIEKEELMELFGKQESSDASMGTTDQVVDKRREDSDLERLVERLVDQLMNQKREDSSGAYLKKSNAFLMVLGVVAIAVAAGYFAKPKLEKQMARIDSLEVATNDLNGRTAAWANDLNRRDLIQGQQIADINAAIAQLRALVQPARGGVPQGVPGTRPQPVV